MQDDVRYLPVSMALPEILPSITRYEAERAAKRIFKHFGSVAQGGPLQTRPAKMRYGVRVCWLSPKPTSGHHKGWGRLIHDVSHDIFRARHPNFRPHDGGHATLEAEIAQFVASSGWLDGTLKPALPNPDLVWLKKKEAIEASIKRWTTKRKRAETALAKLNRQLSRCYRIS